MHTTAFFVSLCRDSYWPFLGLFTLPVTKDGNEFPIDFSGKYIDIGGKVHDMLDELKTRPANELPAKDKTTTVFGEGEFDNRHKYDRLEGNPFGLYFYTN